MASDGNTLAIELTGGSAVAWRRDDGRLTRLGSVALAGPGPGPPGAAPGVARQAVRLRLALGRTVSLAVRSGGRWRDVGGPQEPPRWAGGAHVALRVGGPRGARAEFDSLSIDPR